MYWSGFDTAILITGILTLVLAYVPSTGAVRARGSGLRHSVSA